MKIAFLIVSLFFILPQQSFAGDEVINQLRLFYGQNFINPTQVNEAADAASLNQLKKFDHYGIEAARDISPKFNLGLRLGLRTTRGTPKDSSEGNEYFLYMNQVSLTALLNFSIVKTDKFRFDAFTGFGMGSTTFGIKSSGQDGKLSNGESGPIGQIGVSMAFGQKVVFFKIEGGYEYNKVGSMTKTGTITNNITELDLSGSYFNVGILVDGLKLGRW